jgi:hypothetical protein
VVPAGVSIGMLDSRFLFQTRMMYGPVRYTRAGGPSMLSMAARVNQRANWGWVSMTMKLARLEPGSYHDTFAIHRYGRSVWADRARIVTWPPLPTVTLLACQ